MEGNLEPVELSNSRSTGALVPAEKREAILAHLASGNGFRSAAEKFGLSDHTIQAIRDAELADNPKFSTAYYMSRTPARLLHLASQGIDRMDREMENMPLGVLPVAVGVAIDKYLAMSGQASQVVEHRHSVSLNAASDPFKSGAIDCDATPVP